MAFSIEKYPLIVQVVDTGTSRPRLLIHSPDFGFTMGEDYDSRNIGQTELLIRRMREELKRKLKLNEAQKIPLPSPTLPSQYESLTGSELITATEAARLLRISRMTLWRMCSRGELPFRETPGGHRRFRRSDIESMLLGEETK